MKRDRLEMLTQLALEDLATDDELRALESLLMESRENRRVFREAFHVHEFLKLHTESPSMLRLQGLAPIDEMMRRQRVRSFKVAVFAAAAVVTLMAVLLFGIHSSGEDATSFAVSPSTEFSVDRVKAADSANEIAPGDKVRLESGLMEVRLASGVRSVVQSPADFELTDDGDMVLRRGTIRCEVPPEAVGFKVLSPRLEVIDLGTEFGMVVSRRGIPEVHVFKGSVMAHARDGLGRFLNLPAGQAASATVTGGFATMAADPSRFFNDLPDDLPHLHLSFEPSADGGLAAGGCLPSKESVSVEASPGGPKTVPGRVGRAVHFDGGATPVSTTWMGVGGDRPRTLCAWVRQEPGLPFRHYQTIVGWGDSGGEQISKCEILLFRADDKSPAVFRFTFESLYFSGVTDLADGDWHHVAAVYRGGSIDDPLKPVVDLYVDGRPETIDLELTSTSLGLINAPDTALGPVPVQVGYVPKPEPDRGFRGEIDEVFVFESALSPGRIAQLANP